MTRTSKLFFTCALCFAGFSCSTPPSLCAVDPVTTNGSRIDILQKQAKELQDEKLKYQQWARYADREANQMMSRDWVEYQEYIRMQERAQAKVEEIDFMCKKIEKELKSLEASQHIKNLQSEDGSK